MDYLFSAVAVGLGVSSISGIRKLFIVFIIYTHLEVGKHCAAKPADPRTYVHIHACTHPARPVRTIPPEAKQKPALAATAAISINFQITRGLPARNKEGRDVGGHSLSFTR